MSGPVSGIVSRLALHGGTPVRAEAYPAWPQAGARERELLDEVLASGNWDSRYAEPVDPAARYEPRRRE